jgi:uncharacterized membrane protein YciS (DUF1049 family)
MTPAHIGMIIAAVIFAAAWLSLLLQCRRWDRQIQPPPMQDKSWWEV